MNFNSRPLLFLSLLLIIVGCKNDDDAPTLNVTNEDLAFLYGEGEKTWKLTAYYQDYDYSTLSPFNDCYKDDLYTFKEGSQEVEVELGDVSCYWPQPDVQDANVHYFYDEEQGVLVLEHGRGETSDPHFASRFFMIRLQEISESRLVFASEDNGRYSEALIFEPAEE